MTRMRTATLLVSIALSAVVLLSACGNTLDDSTALVLVPQDARFGDTLQLEGAANVDNYLVRSNWSAEFDSAIDRSLAVESYQVNDATAWDGSDFADDDETAAALTNVLSDSSDGATNCETIATSPGVDQCTYAVGGQDFAILTRSFDTTTMLVLGNNQASIDFISGDFTPIAVQTAAADFS